ncbi:Uncharacterised protein [Mycobacteroides abscessus subsp. abscessus]|nr:Uncharacterised protein [Mycobacteroides abscessus subsp. abscessus]
MIAIAIRDVVRKVRVNLPGSSMRLARMQLSSQVAFGSQA